MIRRTWMVITPQMLSHCVYVWKKSNPDGADFVMYVGSSANGVRRFANHHALPRGEYGHEDYIELLPCGSMREALSLETQLIHELKPQLNKFVPQSDIVVHTKTIGITRRIKRITSSREVTFEPPKKIVRTRAYFGNRFTSSDKV